MISEIIMGLPDQIQYLKNAHVWATFQTIMLAIISIFVALFFYKKSQKLDKRIEKYIERHEHREYRIMNTTIRKVEPLYYEIKYFFDQLNNTTRKPDVEIVHQLSESEQEKLKEQHEKFLKIHNQIQNEFFLLNEEMSNEYRVPLLVIICELKDVIDELKPYIGEFTQKDILEFTFTMHKLEGSFVNLVTKRNDFEKQLNIKR